jgi:hypothetical protein
LIPSNDSCLCQREEKQTKEYGCYNTTATTYQQKVFSVFQQSVHAHFILGLDDFTNHTNYGGNVVCRVIIILIILIIITNVVIGIDRCSGMDESVSEPMSSSLSTWLDTTSSSNIQQPAVAL